MVLTILTADAENNIADEDDCGDWAEAYGSTHPILADEPGFSVHAMNEGGASFPFYMLVDRGMVVDSIVGGGDGEITEEDIVSLL
jgi:hypothetical protein